MREIKSRFWDKVNNKMIVDTAFIKSGSGAGDWILFLDQQVKCDEGLLFPNSAVRSYQSYEEMEYTGIKDKNGTEIYEGDIVKDSNGEGFGFVKYLNCSFLIEWVGLDVYSDLLGWYNYKRGLAAKPADYLVLGNIYENPTFQNLNLQP